MNWAQLLAWVNNAARTLAELVAVATALGLPTAGTLAQVRARLRTRIAAEPNPMGTVPGPVATAAGGPPPPAPPAPGAVNLGQALLSVAGGVLLFVWFAVVIVASSNPDPDVKRLWLTGDFGVMILAGIAGIIALIVAPVIPGMSNRARRGLIYTGTFGTLLTALGLAAMWNMVILPFWAVVSLIVLGVSLTFIAVIVLSYYALR